MHDDHLGRKTKNSLPPYSKLCEIPGSIAKARASEQMGTQTYSYLVQCELIFLFLLTLAWRTRLICACRIAGPDVPNLFKADVDSRWLALPQWVQDQVALNPEAKFLQYRFAPCELLGKGEQSGFLPFQIVPLLEEYLSSHRVRLVHGADPGTLFLNKLGRPFSSVGLNQLIRDTAAHLYGWPRLAVSHFREAFAQAWIARWHHDFLGLSRVLHNRDVSATIRLYTGSRRKQT